MAIRLTWKWSTVERGRLLQNPSTSKASLGHWKSWQSKRTGAPQNRVTQNPLLQQGFSYWALATHASCLLPIGHTQLCMPLCQITFWAAWAGHSRGRSVPSWPKSPGFAANPTSSHQVLHHHQHKGVLPPSHPTTKHDHDEHRHNRAAWLRA